MIEVEIQGEVLAVEVLRIQPLELRIDGRRYAVAAAQNGAQLQLQLNGESFHCQVASDASQHFVQVAHQVAQVHIPDPIQKARAQTTSQGELLAPMPGVVMSCQKAEGVRVCEGESLLTIESMKLQTVLQAPVSGVLKRLPYGVGATFDKGALLAEISSEEETQA